MKLTLVDQRCTACESEEVRSKVTTEEGCLFRCDSCGEDFFVETEKLRVVGTAELAAPPPNDFSLIEGQRSEQPDDETIARVLGSEIR